MLTIQLRHLYVCDTYVFTSVCSVCYTYNLDIYNTCVEIVALQVFYMFDTCKAPLNVMLGEGGTTQCDAGGHHSI